jgi:hypothetical protein
LCLALGSGEPGYGAKGQDEEEADQKTPPARKLLVAIPDIGIILDSISNIPVSHVDVFGYYGQGDVSFRQLFARSRSLQSGRPRVVAMTPKKPWRQPLPSTIFCCYLSTILQVVSHISLHLYWFLLNLL